MVVESGFSGRGAVWLARMTGGHEVAGSSPVAPILQPLAGKQLAGGFLFPIIRRSLACLMLVFFGNQSYIFQMQVRVSSGCIKLTEAVE